MVGTIASFYTTQSVIIGIGVTVVSFFASFKVLARSYKQLQGWTSCTVSASCPWQCLKFAF